MDDAIQDLLEDHEYTVDVERCEEYTHSAKRALLKANQDIGKDYPHLPRTLVNRNCHYIVITARPPVTHSVKLPPIKVLPFAGDVETWARFWEQFESSIDKDPTLYTVNKHVFLRGYLEGEPNILVDGIAVIASAYEDTKKILHDRYGDKNRIIQAHLDHLREVTPMRFGSAEAQNTTHIECNRRIQALRALGENVKAYGRVFGLEDSPRISGRYLSTLDYPGETRGSLWRRRQVNGVFRRRGGRSPYGAEDSK
jgi:hypothetical protein